MADVKNILAAAIEFERFGVEYYRKFHDLVGDQKAKPLMKGLAEDEKEHAKILETELNKLGGKYRPPSRESVKKGLAEIFPEKISNKALATKDAISAIKLGIRTEERSIEYYSKNATAAGPKLKDIFGNLEKMERGHLELLQENLRFLEDDGTWYGYVPFLD